MRTWILAGMKILAALLIAAGCARPPAGTTSKGGAPAKTPEADHDHGPGPHGGAIAECGGGHKYQVELSVDHG